MPFSRAQQLSVLRLRLLGYCSPPSLCTVAARNLHEPAPEWLLLFRQRPLYGSASAFSKVDCGLPLLLCSEKILKTSAKFMYSASTLAYCVKAQSVLNGLTMLCGAFSILAFNTPLLSYQQGYMSCMLTESGLYK